MGSGDHLPGAGEGHDEVRHRQRGCRQRALLKAELTAFIEGGTGVACMPLKAFIGVHSPPLPLQVLARSQAVLHRFVSRSQVAPLFS